MTTVGAIAAPMEVRDRGRREISTVRPSAARSHKPGLPSSHESCLCTVELFVVPGSQFAAPHHVPQGREREPVVAFLSISFPGGGPSSCPGSRAGAPPALRPTSDRPDTACPAVRLRPRRPAREGLLSWQSRHLGIRTREDRPIRIQDRPRRAGVRGSGVQLPMAVRSDPIPSSGSSTSRQAGAVPNHAAQATNGCRDSSTRLMSWIGGLPAGT